MSGTCDFLLEHRLKELDLMLHQRLSETMFVLPRILSRYKLLFPNYTDHTVLHCMTVIEFCNNLIGEEQIQRMSADEIYVLLQACYLHDVGMGVTQKDYEQFGRKLNAQEYFRQHPDASEADFIRDYHHELSAMYIEKYAELFDIPSPEHLFAIRQVARGHRSTDLFDEKEYPADWKVPSGATVCLPYLASLIRLADEIDVVASRNPKLLYDIEAVTNEISAMEFRKHDAIQALGITDDAFIMAVKTEDEALMAALEKLRGKMQHTLDYCREVTHRRTPFVIRQKDVLIRKI